jgi:hypothetical protein
MSVPAGRPAVAEVTDLPWGYWWWVSDLHELAGAVRFTEMHKVEDGGPLAPGFIPHGPILVRV